MTKWDGESCPYSRMPVSGYRSRDRAEYIHPAVITVMSDSSKKIPVDANTGGRSERRNDMSSCLKVSLQKILITKGKN